MIKTVEDSHETEGPPSPRQRGENLLAPFELQPDIGDVLDKRGSALVIGEQLDDLEKSTFDPCRECDYRLTISDAAIIT